MPPRKATPAAIAALGYSASRSAPHGTVRDEECNGHANAQHLVFYILFYAKRAISELTHPMRLSALPLNGI
jgi:hypothetical protein